MSGKKATKIRVTDVCFAASRSSISSSGSFFSIFCRIHLIAIHLYLLKRRDAMPSGLSNDPVLLDGNVKGHGPRRATENE